MELIELNEATKSKRSKWAWTSTNKNRANDLIGLFNKYREYWPLTERFIYYRLISSPVVQMDHWFNFGKPEKGPVKIYSRIGPLLKWLRIDEYLPWEAVVDENRTLSGKVGFTNPAEFINQELGGFLQGYKRCLAHRQEHYIEVWIEKAALYHIVKPVVDKYCRRLMCCRGYNSVSFQASFYDRATEALSHGQIPVVLYFGDWDPSGVNMLYAAAQTLIDELGLCKTHFYRCGINPEHFGTLQADPVPIKPTDSRAKKFVKQHGTTAYELDALEPEDLKSLVEKSIQRFTDMNSLQEDLGKEPEDLLRLDNLRAEVCEIVEDRLGDMFG